MSLRAAAEAQLMQAEAFPLLQPLRSGQVLLRIWRHPAFSAWVSWTVIGFDRQLIVRRLRWPGAEPDHADAPLIIAAEGLLPRETWSPLISRLRAITLPVFVDGRGASRDGDVCGLELPRGDGMTRVDWWPAPPPGWEALAAWHADMIAACERVLPGQPPGVKRQ